MLRPGRRHHHRNDEAAAAAAGDLLINAIDDSITSVFVVTFKMALFFGVYTYVVNCMFGVSVVYLTSIVAAFLACLPLLGTYWCALIGVLELWLVAHKPLSAALYGVMHLLPSLLAVDRAIYSEIKVGHPYLSSLAFAGGVYCLGLEGVIIGPLVLCLLIVVVQMIASGSSSSSSTHTIPMPPPPPSAQMANVTSSNKTSTRRFSHSLSKP